MLSRNLEQTLHRSLSLASERRHEYATLEHLLLGLADDSDAATVLRACGVDLDKLRSDLVEFLDGDLAGLATGSSGDPKPTAGFQRVVQRAAIHVQSSGRDEITGANVLVSLFSERESHAVYFLQLHDITRLDAVNFISHGIAKAPGRSIQQTATSIPTVSTDDIAIPVRNGNPVGNIGPPGDMPNMSDSGERLPSAPAVSMADPNLTKIFVSYSHRDTKWVDRLQVHLRPMERDGLIQRWDDRLIQPGRNWRDEIRSAIEAAKIAILIISADFLASEFISRNELPPLLQSAKERGTHILPILVSPSRFVSTASLSSFQAFNPPSKPLSAMTGTQREMLFVSVADKIEQMLQAR
jgi:hypothetical protein